jgi:23S rRNA pseudouridine2457 synthase
MLIAFHKPYGVLSRFTSDGSSHQTLARFGFPKGVYPLGRLDADSEGLLLLSDEAALNRALLDPSARHPRLYWVQVERQPNPEALRQLETGLDLRGHRTRPARVWILHPQPDVPDRTPPIRYRKTVPTCWLAMVLVEGKNRQVRRMTAAIGHPTLRLIRRQIGCLDLGDLQSGQWKKLDSSARIKVFQRPARWHKERPAGPRRLSEPPG